jgi:hypothetical protein
VHSIANCELSLLIGSTLATLARSLSMIAGADYLDEEDAHNMLSHPSIRRNKEPVRNVQIDRGGLLGSSELSERLMPKCEVARPALYLI